MSWTRWRTGVRIEWLALAILLPAAAQDAAALKDFDKRTGDYEKLHRKAGSDLPALTSTASAAEIVSHQRELARRIQAARPNAQQGDIFTQPIATEFRRRIGVAMQGREAKRIRQSLREAEPVTAPLRVDDPYPAKVPLQSTPPSLLFNLPRLPGDLDYRVVGHSLVLRDAEANLIVDFMPEAIP